MPLVDLPGELSEGVNTHAIVEAQPLLPARCCPAGGYEAPAIVEQILAAEAEREFVEVAPGVSRTLANINELAITTEVGVRDTYTRQNFGKIFLCDRKLDLACGRSPKSREVGVVELPPLDLLFGCKANRWVFSIDIVAHVGLQRFSSGVFDLFGVVIVICIS